MMTTFASQNSVPPKTVRTMYRKHELLLIFCPDTRTWRWKTKHTYVVEFDGIARTQERALREAKRTVDRLVDGE
jgi:hypothetical protein